MAQLYTYNPDSVVLTVIGVRLFGFGDGTHIEVKRDEDQVTKKVGNDGSTCAAVNRNKGGLITVHLHQGSPCNDYLSSLARSTDLGVLITGTTDLHDLLSPETSLLAPNSWVKAWPESPYAKEGSMRSWMIDCAELYMNLSGSVVA